MQVAKSLDDFKRCENHFSTRCLPLRLDFSNSQALKKKLPWVDFAQMRQALEAGVIDAYVSERPEALTAESANAKFKMIQPETWFQNWGRGYLYRYRSS